MIGQDKGVQDLVFTSEDIEKNKTMAGLSY